MVCQYCNKRLGIIQRLKGLSFCSLEHQELHFGLSFERLRESVTEFTPKPKLEKPEAKLEPAQAELKEPQAKTEQPQAGPDQRRTDRVLEPQALKLQVPEPQTPEPQAKEVEQETGQETSPTLEIANLVGAVGTSVETDLPEASFLPEVPSRQDQPASPLMSYAAEPVSTTVQLPVSPVGELPRRAARSLVLEISPAEPQAEVMPLASQATWRPVPEGYPPVVVSASATLLLDANGADLVPLRMGEPFRGKGPVPPPQAVAIETPLRQPRLPSRQSDHAWASGFTSFPHAAASRPTWEGRIGRGPALPPLTGVLRPQRDLARLVPPVERGHFQGLSTFPFFAEKPEAPVPPPDLLVTPAAPIEATITARTTIYIENAPSTSRALAMASSPLALSSTIPLRGDPSFSEVHSQWEAVAVTSRLPHATVPPPELAGLSMAAATGPLAWSSVANFPLNVAAAPAVTSVIPFLVLSRPSSITVPAMPSWATMQPLSLEACRFPAPVTEHQFDQSAAYLHPSLPSPLSLVTWSHSLSISIPPRNASKLGGPAPVGVSAIQSRPQALRPWSPNRRAYRPTPVLPQPNRVVWAPVAPMQASLRPPVILPIRPGTEGTAPPSLAPVRVQPALMPMLPPATALFGVVPVTGLAVLGPSSEDALKLACFDMAHSALRAAWDLRVESHTVLPSFSAESHAPAIDLAPSSYRGWWCAMPPAQPVSMVQPFLAQNRLASSLTAGLPDSGLGSWHEP